jgi:hypothetical protein
MESCDMVNGLLPSPKKRPRATSMRSIDAAIESGSVTAKVRLPAAAFVEILGK